MENKKNFYDFVDIMRRLTADDGCPWDREQTHDSLKRYMIEECYEAVEAINNNDSENLCEELGDVLLQVVFHSILSEKEGSFNIDDVTDGVSRKMIYRHPHIFFDAKADTASQVLQNWDSIKKTEKGYSSYTEEIKNIPKALPSLIRAEKVIKKIQKSGIIKSDFEKNISFLIDLASKIGEVKNGNKALLEEIIGKMLLSIINISHFLQINADFSLTNALETYINRFEDFENMTAAVGGVNEDTDPEDVEIFEKLFMG